MEVTSLLAIQVGRRGEEQPGVRVLRVVKQRLHRPGLGDLAGVHDRGPAAGLRDNRQVVGDEDDGEAELVGEAGEKFQDLGLDHDVEGGGGLVREQDLGLAGQRHRDRRALAHAAGELVRVALGRASRDADEFEQLARAPPRRLTLGDAVEGHGLGNLPADLLDRIQGVHRALEHHRDVLPSVLADRVLAACENADPVDANVAGERGVRRQQAHQREDRRGLAAA